MEEYMIPCLSKQMFGLDCPGCGTQRAFVMLMEGKFYDAWHFYPPIYTLILFFMALAVHFIDFKRGHHKWVIATGILNAITMLVAYIYKWIVLL